MNKRIMLKGRLKRHIPHSTGDETKFDFNRISFGPGFVFIFFVLWGLGAQVWRQITPTSSSSVARWGREGELLSAAGNGNGLFAEEPRRCYFRTRIWHKGTVPQWCMGGAAGNRLHDNLVCLPLPLPFPPFQQAFPRKRNKTKKIGRGQREIREPFLPTIHPAKKIPRKK